jgi:hypothetical protein
MHLLRIANCPKYLSANVRCRTQNLCAVTNGTRGVGAITSAPEAYFMALVRRNSHVQLFMTGRALIEMRQRVKQMLVKKKGCSNSTGGR